jgi:hypothetical protein
VKPSEANYETTWSPPQRGRADIRRIRHIIRYKRLHVASYSILGVLAARVKWRERGGVAELMKPAKTLMAGLLDSTQSETLVSPYGDVLLVLHGVGSLFYLFVANCHGLRTLRPLR